jgi:glycosyltransferase involved in cell wall biosynthesis
MKKILVLTEATYLNTGYAADGRGLIQGLINRGYDVAEFSVYGAADDPRRSSIKWKNYPNVPCGSDSDEVKKAYASNISNQFGAWRLERAALDFKPDAVLDMRDFWMCSFVRQSPFRNLFHWCLKSTIDAMPQNAEWVNTFASANSFLTLTHWGQSVIKDQSDQDNYGGVAGICFPESYNPVPKIPHKISMGINPDWKIIGTVMRNQRRKMFPELFEAFGKYLEETGEKNVYLYCHTSYPDNGWDIPQLLIKENISNRVLFTYSCDCGKITTSTFVDTIKQCTSCKRFTSRLSNVNHGASIEDLKRIYQCFDIYVQCANSEGFGVPVIEAGACGIPVMGTDYSAMSETVRMLSGFPIDVKSSILELETGCYRAKPDVLHMVDIWKSFFSLTEDQIQELSNKTRELTLEHYNWENVLDVWSASIDKSEGCWDIPLRQVNPAENPPDGLNNKQFLDWCVDNFLPYSDLKDSYDLMCLLRDLNFGSCRKGPCGYFYSENSYFDRVNYTEFSRKDVINMFKSKCDVFNFWEKVRCGVIKLQEENWLV